LAPVDEPPDPPLDDPPVAPLDVAPFDDPPVAASVGAPAFPPESSPCEVDRPAHPA
jgi:hypothetical protein